MKYLVFCIAVFSLLFVMPLNAQQADDDVQRPRDSFYERETVLGRIALEQPPVRESDILWSKRVWQQIDLRETINQPLYFPIEPTGQYRSLMQVLEDGIREGKITAYDRNDETLSGPPLDPESAFDTWYSEEIIDGDISIEEFRARDVVRYQILEEWFIDRRRSIMDVRIIAILPIRRFFDDVTGQFEYQGVLWLPFDEVRQVIANAPVHNRNTDGHTTTFDDIFLRRTFSSRIIRESRPDGLLISEYPGFENRIDQLMESQRILESIRNKELDMWHY